MRVIYSNHLQETFDMRKDASHIHHRLCFFPRINLKFIIVSIKSENALLCVYLINLLESQLNFIVHLNNNLATNRFAYTIN